MSRTTTTSLITAVLAAAAFAFSQWGDNIPLPDGISLDQPAKAAPAEVKPLEVPASAKKAERLLDGLTITDRPPSSDSTYDRDAFGEAWADIDGNGCNQRDDVLFRDVDRKKPFTAAQQGACDHDMLAGTWYDPYTGKNLVFTDLKAPDQSQAIQADHIVPLSEAWKSGANKWTPERREQYANTLNVLLAVDGPANMSKGDQDPASWRPRKDYQCRYARTWIQVKATWSLAVDPSEKNALREMLGDCP